MNVKSEKYFQDYLKKLSDDAFLNFYQDFELTHFPFLVLDEFSRRYKSQGKKEKILKKLKTRTGFAALKGKEISQIAKMKSSVMAKMLKDVSSSGYARSLEMAKAYGSSGKDDLILIEKLGKLKKSGLITTQEFEKKKKELLDRL